MKRLILGDIHGHDIWKHLIKIENPDEVIFLGDYVDAFHVPVEEQISNFNEILEFIEEFNKIHGDDACMLCLGNHDFHYFNVASEQYSGYNVTTQFKLGNRMEELYNQGVLRLAIVDHHNKVIYSHAGVTSSWMNERVNVDDIDTIIENKPIKELKFTYANGGDCYGSSSWSSPIWVRPATLYKFPYNKDGIVYTQIVGHTHIRNKVVPIAVMAPGCEQHGVVYLMDALPSQYIVEEFEPDTRKIVCRQVKERMLEDA